MIWLLAHNEEDFFALQSLHEMTGLVTEDAILFATDPLGPTIKGDPRFKLKVIFRSDCSASGMAALPHVSWSDGCLEVTGGLLSKMVKWLAGEGPWENPLSKVEGHMQVDRGSPNELDPHIPYLDEMIEVFTNALTNALQQKNVPYQIIKPWDKPVICLTHDADSIQGKSLLRYAYWIMLACGTFKPSAFRSALRKIRKTASADLDPHFSFAYIRNEEDRYGFRSTFFLMSLKSSLGREGRRYSVRHHGLKQTLEKLADEGFEIGLHPTGDAYCNSSTLQSQHERLKAIVTKPLTGVGVRNHYLRFKVPITWRIQENLSIVYDATWGWSDRCGFRAGTSRPFRPFDREKNRRLNVWEVPLIVMDGALQSYNAPLQIIGELAERCFSYGGIFTALWHTNLVSPMETPELNNLFTTSLKYLSDLGCAGLTSFDAIQRYQEYSLRMEKNRRRLEGADQ